MSNNLYEEALADVRKLTEVAENNAKQAVLNAVVPRIQKLIENELLGSDPGETHPALDQDDEVDLDSAISPPDEEGKVTLDLDALNDSRVKSGDEEFELDLESKNVIKALRSKKVNEAVNVAKKLNELESTVKIFQSGKGVTVEQISRTIDEVESMYGYVQEHVADKEKYEGRLESIFSELTNIQESMSKSNRNNRLNEDEQLDLDADASGDEVDLDAAGSDDGDDGNELTLKLTGLPDGVDLDNIGVDLVGDDSGDEGDDSGDEGDDDEEVLDLDFGGDDQDGDVQGQKQVQGESRRFNDNDVVEIDENMLRAEISRMSRLNENSESCDANGNGVDSAAMDDFGGGTDEGEPFLDGEVRTADDDPKVALRKESVLQRRLHSRMRSIRNEARGKSGRRLAELKARFNSTKRRFNESIQRAQGFRKQISESVSSHSQHPNGAAQRRSDRAVNNLRRKLAESNLQSIKLTYANKVLQSDVLNKRQRAQVIRALDECRTAREAKLVYNSIVQRLSGARSNVNEGRVVGSPSRPTKPASSTVLSEGFQTERWQKLAGIKK